MRQDLEILQELFLPLLEEIAAYSPRLADDLASGDAFWVHFNDVLLRGGAPLQDLLTDYGAKDVAYSHKQCETLSAAYLAYLAHSYCSGQTNPTVNMLLQTADARFAAEIDFQKDMLAAITHAGRAALKTEVEQASEFAGADIVDEEILAAYNAIQRDTVRDDLKKQLKEWDKEAHPGLQPAERKRRRTIPFLFFRFAAAAAVFTAGIVGVVKVYNNQGSNSASPGHYPSDADTMAGVTARQPKTVQPSSTDTGNNNTGGRVADSTVNGIGRASANVVHKPHIVLKCNIADLQTAETITEVLVTIEDDKGRKQTVFSKDGTFSVELALHRDYFITGKKEHYVSAVLSLSTKDVKETDADDVINTTLRLSKGP